MRCGLASDSSESRPAPLPVRASALDLVLGEDHHTWSSCAESVTLVTVERRMLIGHKRECGGALLLRVPAPAAATPSRSCRRSSLCGEHAAPGGGPGASSRALARRHSLQGFPVLPATVPWLPTRWLHTGLRQAPLRRRRRPPAPVLPALCLPTLSRAMLAQNLRAVSVVVTANLRAVNLVVGFCRQCSCHRRVARREYRCRVRRVSVGHLH